MSQQTSSPPSLGEVGFSRYGDEPGKHGPWTTFDGRPMPRWDALTGEAGAHTRHRWDVAATAIIEEHAKRKAPELQVLMEEALGHLGFIETFDAPYLPEAEHRTRAKGTVSELRKVLVALEKEFALPTSSR